MSFVTVTKHVLKSWKTLLDEATPNLVFAPKHLIPAWLLSMCDFLFIERALDDEEDSCYSE